MLRYFLESGIVNDQISFWTQKPGLLVMFIRFINVVFSFNVQFVRSVLNYTSFKL